MKTALISVYDKTGLEKLVNILHKNEVNIISTGGTADFIRKLNIPVKNVSDVTKYSEILDGRVKTLHPKIFGGILCNKNNPKHVKEIKERGIEFIDLVVCNLYPFRDTLKKKEVKRKDIIENIDIGGVSLMRAAAKNVDSGVVVFSDPNDYMFINWFLKKIGNCSEIAMELAAKAFSLTTDYDLHVANWMYSQLERNKEDKFPEIFGGYRKGKKLRYGENPHQKAFLYAYNEDDIGIANSVQMHGKELSYNNYLDMESTFKSVLSLDKNQHCCVIVKHTNPCGIAMNESQSESFKKALECDKLSAFGSVVAFNKVLEKETVESITESKLFIECVIVPGFDNKETFELLKKKSKDLRIVISGYEPNFNLHKISGGVLVQENDKPDTNEWKIVTKHEGIEDEDWKQLQFAMACVMNYKSNAIVLVKDNQLIGFGCGQTNRIDALKQAIEKNLDKVEGSYMASDAFFPFSDCVELANKYKIKCIVQPGGSKRDQESIEKCNEYDIPMVFTEKRHFKH